MLADVTRQRGVCMRFTAIAMWVGGTLAIGAGTAHSQAPDAGALMRQTEQSLHMQTKPSAPSLLPMPMTINEATRVTAGQIRFAGVKRLSVSKLEAVSRSFLNRPLDAHELQHLTDAVSNAYRESGWVVRVYIAQQNPSNSDLLIQVLENLPPSAR
jgi:hemolysin activation/secretion protein